MPRQAKVQPTEIELRPGVSVPIGAQVRYYRNGWRVGAIESAKGKEAKVRPIVAKFRLPHRLLSILLVNIEPLEGVTP